MKINNTFLFAIHFLLKIGFGILACVLLKTALPTMNEYLVYGGGIFISFLFYDFVIRKRINEYLLSH